MSGEALYERYKDALRRGHVASLRGRLEEALTAYAEAAAIAPERATPHTSAGTALMRRKRPADAVRHYTAAVRLAPRDEAALLGRAQALTALDRRAQAADAYDAVAEVQAANGKLADAVDSARRGLELAEGRERRRTLERLIERPACLRAGRARPGRAREGHGGARGRAIEPRRRRRLRRSPPRRRKRRPGGGPAPPPDANAPASRRAELPAEPVPGSRGGESSSTATTADAIAWPSADTWSRGPAPQLPRPRPRPWSGRARTPASGRGRVEAEAVAQAPTRRSSARGPTDAEIETDRRPTWSSDRGARSEPVEPEEPPRRRIGRPSIATCRRTSTWLRSRARRS